MLQLHSAGAPAAVTGPSLRAKGKRIFCFELFGTFEADILSGTLPAPTVLHPQKTFCLATAAFPALLQGMRSLNTAVTSGVQINAVPPCAYGCSRFGGCGRRLKQTPHFSVESRIPQPAVMKLTCSKKRVKYHAGDGGDPRATGYLLRGGRLSLLCCRQWHEFFEPSGPLPQKRT